METRDLPRAFGWYPRPTAGHQHFDSAPSNVSCKIVIKAGAEANQGRDSLLEITNLLRRNAPDLQKSIERTHSLRVSHPQIEVALSLYSQEDHDSVYASTNCLQAPSELNFDFDDIVVNSTAYRRALAAAQRSSPIAQQDDSEGLASVPDGVEPSQYARALYDFDKDNPNFLTVREGDTFEVLVETGIGWSYGSIDGVQGWLPSKFCEMITSTSSHDHQDVTDYSDLASTTVGESSSEAEETPAKEKLTFKKLWEERTADYAEMVLELQAEKQRRIVEYAARQAELDRLQELLEVQAMSEAARARGVSNTLDNMQQHTEPAAI